MGFAHDMIKIKDIRVAFSFNVRIFDVLSADDHELFSNAAMIQFIADDFNTGKSYNGEFTHNQLVKISPLFHMPDEVLTLLGRTPFITYDRNGQCFANFKFTGKAKKYWVALPLKFSHVLNSEI